MIAQEFLIRIMSGDILFSITAWASGLIAFVLVLFSKRWSKPIKILFVAVLSFAITLLAHHYLDVFQIWYNTPLAEEMHLIIR